MGKIDIFRNAPVMFITSRNDVQCFRNTLLRIVQATAGTRSGTVHSLTWDNEALFSDDFGRTLLLCCSYEIMRSHTCLHARTYTHTHTHTHTHNLLRLSWILSRTTRASRHQKGKTNLGLLEQEIVSGNGISWPICKSAP